MLCYVIFWPEIIYSGPGITKVMSKEAVLQTDVGRNHTPSCFKGALGKVTLGCLLSLPKKRQVTVTYSNSASQFQTDHVSHAAF